MPEPTPFNVAGAPFRVREGAGPQDVASEIVATFDLVSGLPDKATQSLRAAMNAAGVSPGEPLYRAGVAIARDIDAGIGDGAGNPYHNSQHFCEVLLSALCLSQLSDLTKAEQAQLLVAALGHDFHHDGGTERRVPFQQEGVAVSAVTPYLQAAAVPADQQRRVAALILSTEISTGMPFANRCYRHFFGGAARPETPRCEERLAPLGSDPRLALQAVLLTEADVLPSVGLTVEYGERYQMKLSREWGRPLGPADKLHFLENVFGEFTASRFFSPNLERLKQAARAQEPGS
jgi:hypothetical protein